MTKEPFLGVVQFPHPGPEHQVGKEGWTSWNLKEHRRKFLSLRGRYHDLNDQDRVGDFAAWGEWEGPSQLVRRFDRPPKTDALARKTEPRALVEPVFPGSARPTAGLQNTDPNIFGDRFRYTLCKQISAGRPTMLTRLSPGTLVLFGSNLCGNFVLDTAFVVSDASIKHRRTNWLAEVGPQISQCYRAVTMEPMYGDPATPDELEFSLYQGATVSNPVHGMFSFVPCLPIEDVTTRGFPRPAIDLGEFTTSKNLQNFKTTAADLDAIAKAWQSLVEQVRAAGLCLGLQVHEPDQRPAPEHVWPGPDESGRLPTATC